MKNKTFSTVSQSEIQGYVNQGRQLQAEALANSLRKLRVTIFRK